MSKYKLTDTILYVDKMVAGYDGTPVLSIENIEEKNVVIDGSITGQTIAIVGRSGSGKSTFFNILSGLKNPMSGQVLISDIKNNLKAKVVSEGDISFVDQKYTLFRNKTVYQTCSYALRKDNRSKEEKDKFIIDSLTDWGLIKHKDKYPCELSGGQRQRVAYLEKVMTNNMFMILDEPISGLDVVAVDNIKASMNKFKGMNELNTIIFSTHDINFAVEMADVIYVIGLKDPKVDTVSTVLKKFDLKELGLYGEKFGIKHLELSEEVKNVIRSS